MITRVVKHRHANQKVWIDPVQGVYVFGITEYVPPAETVWVVGFLLGIYVNGLAKLVGHIYQLSPYYCGSRP